MKYLLLLLLSFNCFAKYKVDVTNNKGRSFCDKPRACVHDTMLEASTWASENANKGDWGENDRWLRMDVPIAGYTNQREVQDIDSGETYTEYFYPKEYSYTITDISTEIAAEEAEKASENTEKSAVRTLIKDLDTKLDKKSTETVAEYRTRRALLLKRIIRKLARDIYGKEQ